MAGVLDTPELRAFRREVRAAIRADLTEDLAELTRGGLHLPREAVARWQATLHARGWGAPHWPTAHGGPGWDAYRRYIFEEECALADAPPGDVLGLHLAGPMLIAHGSEDQKRRHLPAILSGAEFWCQGFSEPEAGSDLASLRTTARRDGDEWVINGQKTWLTEGHQADQMFVLARTDPEARAQAGLSQFIVDMRTPGLRLHPIITIDEGHSVNAIFLDEVRVPAENIIGEPNKGWDYAKELLARERTNNAQAPRTKRDIIALQTLARACEAPDGRPMADAGWLRRRLAGLAADYLALETAVLSVLADEMAGREPGPIASTLKIRGSELQQQVTETAMEVLGRTGLALEPDYGAGPSDPRARGWVERHLFRRVVTIYAGSNEIQRTIIARSILGMRG